MKKPASKVAEPAQIQPKSQFLFHKNLPPRDFSIMTLHTYYDMYSLTSATDGYNVRVSFVIGQHWGQGRAS